MLEWLAGAVILAALLMSVIALVNSGEQRGAAAAPGVAVVTQAGRFQWYCIIPCDSDANGWAMQNAGYMSGYITAT